VLFGLNTVSRTSPEGTIKNPGHFHLQNRIPALFRPGKKIFQPRAVPALNEAAQLAELMHVQIHRLENSIAIHQGDISPHGRVRGGYPGKIPETAR
jgi:hypothetical protein